MDLLKKIQECRPDFKTIDEFISLVNYHIEQAQLHPLAINRFQGQPNEIEYIEYENILRINIIECILQCTESKIPEVAVPLNTIIKRQSLKEWRLGMERFMKQSTNKELSKERKLSSTVFYSIKERELLSSMYDIDGESYTIKIPDNFICDLNIISKSYKLFDYDGYFESLDYYTYLNCFNLNFAKPNFPSFKYGYKIKFVYFLKSIKGMNCKMALERFGVKDYDQEKRRGKDEGWKTLGPTKKREIDALFK